LSTIERCVNWRALWRLLLMHYAEQFPHDRPFVRCSGQSGNRFRFRSAQLAIR